MGCWEHQDRIREWTTLKPPYKLLCFGREGAEWYSCSPWRLTIKFLNCLLPIWSVRALYLVFLARCIQESVLDLLCEFMNLQSNNSAVQGLKTRLLEPAWAGLDPGLTPKQPCDSWQDTSAFASISSLGKQVIILPQDGRVLERLALVDTQTPLAVLIITSTV